MYRPRNISSIDRSLSFVKMILQFYKITVHGMAALLSGESSETYFYFFHDLFYVAKREHSVACFSAEFD